MRGLVAAHVALGSTPEGVSELYDTREGLACAVDYADSLVLRQSFTGYWRLGYHAKFWADMAAAVGLFPALEPFVDADRLRRYQRAADRFMKGLARDRMLLASGAVGVGRLIMIDPMRTVRPDHRPYLVSTALAGIMVRAWLFHRTHQEAYRTDALAALEYTFSKISEDGFADEHVQQEGPLRIAAYVHEGWIAADTWLEHPSVEQRLREEMPRHVAWLLRMQAPDGTWDAGRVEETTRTVPIVGFLVWYDQRFGPNPDVRAAVRRAGAVFTDPDRWPAIGWFSADEHSEVMRAQAGRPLATLAANRYIIP